MEAAAAAGQIPLGGNGDTWGFHVEARPSGPHDPSVERYSVTPDYFAVMRIPLRRGRLFTDADRGGAQNVMLIGEQTARTLWPDADPIGQRVRIGGNDGPWRTIVGIVGDVRHQELAAPPTMQMYTAAGADHRLVSDDGHSIRHRPRGARCRGAADDLVGRRRCAGLRGRDAGGSGREIGRRRGGS